MGRWQQRNVILCLLTLAGAVSAQTKRALLIGMSSSTSGKVTHNIVVREPNGSGRLLEWKSQVNARSIQKLFLGNSSFVAAKNGSRPKLPEIFVPPIRNAIELCPGEECKEKNLLIFSYAGHDFRLADSLIGMRNLVNDAIGILRAEFAQAEKNSRGLPDSDSNKQDSMNLLTRLATEQIGVDGGFLGRTRFSIDQQSNTFYYDLSSVPSNLVLSGGDIYASELEALIRVESLRRDFRTTIPKEKFWIAPLQSIQQVIERCVQKLEALQQEQESGEDQRECSQRINQQFEALRAPITSYASANNLKLVDRPLFRDPVSGYTVHVKVDPPSASVRVMTLLEYKKNQYFKIPRDHYRWNELLDSEYDMIGWYHYRAEWPPELNGPEEGDFEIRKPSTITFRPKTK